MHTPDVLGLVKVPLIYLDNVSITTVYRHIRLEVLTAKSNEIGLLQCDGTLADR